MSKLWTWRGVHSTGNRLSEVPTQLMSCLGLTELDMCNNRLTTLPENFGDLGSLNHLDLSLNDLKTLPFSCSRLSNLKWLKVDGNNPRFDIPVKIVEHGPEAVVKYLQYFVDLAPPPDPEECTIL